MGVCGLGSFREGTEIGEVVVEVGARITWYVLDLQVEPVVDVPRYQNPETRRIQNFTI
jgi:hypothetical protein